MTKAAIEDDWPRTVAEFEIWHARQPERWEFIGGRPCLMAPGSIRHTIVKGNVFLALDRALADTPCQVYVSGAQILTEEISAIPDVVVSCAPVDLSTPVVAEPTIIVEVMSPWSEVDDTQRKWFSYRKIPSLKHYLVVAQDRREVLVTAAPASSGASVSSASARSSSRIRRCASRSPRSTSPLISRRRTPNL